MAEWFNALEQDVSILGSIALLAQVLSEEEGAEFDSHLVLLPIL